MAAVMVESDGGDGNVGLFVMAVTMLWANVVVAATTFGSFRTAMGRWADSLFVLLAPPFLLLLALGLGRWVHVVRR
jgi:hypothetical protein